MWLPTSALGGSSPEPRCPRDDDSATRRGSLSRDPTIEAALQAIVTFGPSLWVLLASPYTIQHLWRAELVVRPNRRGYAKMAVTLILLALQLVHIFGDGVQLSPWPSSLAAQLLFLARDITVCILSFLEHGRNVAPSTVMTVYLLLATASDAIQASLLYVAWNLCLVPRLAAVTFAARLVLLVLESQTKTSILREPYHTSSSPEETAGFLGRCFFWWVSKVLKAGYTKTLSLSDMPPLGKALDVAEARQAMLKEWGKRQRPEGRFTLLLAQWNCLWWPNMYIIPPRVVFVLLQCCQPLLISRTIQFVTKISSPFETRNEAFRLLLFTFIIYTGMAVCDAMHQRLLARAEFLSRMGLIGVLYNDALTLKDGVSDETAAVTLMSTDAGNAANFASLFHDTWSKALELCIAMYMLADQMGWVCIVPPLVVLAASRIVKYITDDINERYMAFSQATQTRISATKAVLDSMKNIKMMGLVEKTEFRIQSTREDELKEFTRFYKLMVAFFCSCNPAMTLIFYAVQAQFREAKSFDVDMIFTSIAIIDLVATPANTLLNVMAEVASVMASFQRIQKHLLTPTLDDKRETMAQDNDGSNISPESQPLGSFSLAAVEFHNAIVRPASAADPVLHSISTQCKLGDLVVVAGAVGVGKTTFAKAVLGDLPPDSGTIYIANRAIAYCSQTPWLINGTIKEVICGPCYGGSVKEVVRYKDVVHACDLQEDFDQMPEGDQTVIGSRGVMLSGGQRQRVALARAVFADRDLVILDDVLSALDASTERRIVDRLLGPKGLFKQRGTTVILISHAAQHLALADHIVILDKNGRIEEQGTWECLRNGSGYTSNVKLQGVKAGDDRPTDRAEPRETTPSAPDQADQSDRMRDITRKAGDIAIYKYYIGAIGTRRLLILASTLTLYAALQGAIPYWLRWMAESKGERMWFYTGTYFLLTSGAFLTIASAVSTIFLVIAPHAGSTLHARLLRAVMHAPLSFFSTTDTGTTLNRFSSDMAMIDRTLPFALFQVLQAVFLLLSQCILLAIVQPLITVTLPFTIAAVYVIQKVYLATSKQLRFIDLETRALVNANFLETLEGVSTIRAFGWQQAFIDKNISKLDLSLRPDYLLMCIQRWLDLVLDLIVPGLALGIIGLAIALKGTTTGGQVGIALNVVLKANAYILRLITAFTKLETSLGAISRLRAFEQEVQPEEKPGMLNFAPASWPSNGVVEFTDFSARYNASTLALQSINVSIAAGTKVGVVGRTGSGKSSLLLSLLRLVEAHGEGKMMIDGLDICHLPRNFVRSRIITVPQDPMLIQTDSVRQNLDIAGANISDDDMVAVLDRVGLWKTLLARSVDAADSSDSSSNDSCSEINDDDDASPADETDLSAAAVLSLPMKKLPLSQGQQQLFSLARALLMRHHRGRVVLLDEATSNVDAETDRVMQIIVRDAFQNHTVITVAHRLDTIMDSDVVLVLSGGKLVEVESPGELSVKEGGAFRALLSGEE